MANRGLYRTEAKRAYNLREKQLYHEYRKTHGPLKGGQKGFRALLRKLPVARRPSSLLSPRQRSNRDTALHVLARSRRFGESLTKAARNFHTSPKTVRRYLGRSGYRKVGGRWKPTRSDSLLRRMAFYEEGRERVVTVRGSKTASLIGKYDRDVRTFLEDPARDPSVLKKWKGKTFRDASGNLHTFETDPYKLREAAERAANEPEGLELNSEGTGEAVAFL
jgi:hypothetical protein